MPVRNWELGTRHFEKPMTKKQVDFLFDYFLANGKNIKEYDRILTRKYTA